MAGKGGKGKDVNDLGGGKKPVFRAIGSQRRRPEKPLSSFTRTKDFGREGISSTLKKKRGKSHYKRHHRQCGTGEFHEEAREGRWVNSVTKKTVEIRQRGTDCLGD